MGGGAPSQLQAPPSRWVTQALGTSPPDGWTLFVWGSAWELRRWALMIGGLGPAHPPCVALPRSTGAAEERAVLGGSVLSAHFPSPERALGVPERQLKLEPLGAAPKASVGPALLPPPPLLQHPGGALRSHHPPS